MKRLPYLDYLRGLSALGVVVFHYTSWSLHEHASEDVLGRVGIYCVAIFYVLSGLTLHHAYHGQMDSWAQVRKFFVRRAFRIFPLLWFATATTLVIFFYETRNWAEVFLNLTGLFSIVKWDANIAIGAWSIGNELAFYLFVPLLVYLARKSSWGLLALGAVSAAIYFYFAFEVLQPDVPLDAQWRDYVNPLNQGFLFVGGFIIGHFMKDISFKHPGFPLAFIAIGVLVLALFPAQGDPSNLVTGTARVVFTLACFLVCVGAYKLEWSAPRWVDLPLGKLGEASYSVYLLHPLVYRLTTLVYLELFHYPLSIQFGASIVLTLVLGYWMYKYVERYFIRLGRRLT
jgi:exopolysaccharide production protein ExoZ